MDTDTYVVSSTLSVTDTHSKKARALRDSLLAATDWTANSDITMSGEMRTYRQALRDVPAQEGFPDDVTWPTKP